MPSCTKQILDAAVREYPDIWLSHQGLSWALELLIVWGRTKMCPRIIAAAPTLCHASQFVAGVAAPFSYQAVFI